MSIKTYFKQLLKKLQLLGEEPDDDYLVEMEGLEIIPVLPEIQVEPEVEEPHIEEPHIEESHIDESHIEEPHIEEPHIDEPHIDESHIKVDTIEEVHVPVPLLKKRPRRLPPKKIVYQKVAEPIKKPKPSPRYSLDSLVPLTPENYKATSTLRTLSDARVCTSKTYGIFYRCQVITISDFLNFYQKHQNHLYTLWGLNTTTMAEVCSLYEQLHSYYSPSLHVMDGGDSAECNPMELAEVYRHLSKADKMALECYCKHCIKFYTTCPGDSPVVYSGLERLLLKLPFFEKNPYTLAGLRPLYKRLKQMLYVYQEANFQTKAILEQLSEVLPDELYRSLCHKVRLRTLFDSLTPSQHALLRLHYAGICQRRVSASKAYFIEKYNLQWADTQQCIFSIPTLEVNPLLFIIREQEAYLPGRFIEAVENAIVTVAGSSPAEVFHQMIRLKWQHVETTPFAYPYYLCHGTLPLFFMLQQQLIRLKKINNQKFIDDLLSATLERSPLLIEMLDNSSLWAAYDLFDHTPFLRSDSSEIAAIRSRESVSFSNEFIIRILAHVHRKSVCLFDWNKLWLIDRTLTRYMDFNQLYRRLQAAYRNALKTNEEIDVRRILAENAKVKLEGIVAVGDLLFQLGVSLLLNDIMKK